MVSYATERVPQTKSLCYKYVGINCEFHYKTTPIIVKSKNMFTLHTFVGAG